MTTERWLRIEALFGDALDRPPHERAAFLDAACADDADLRAEVARLLAGHDAPAPVLDTPPSHLAALGLLDGDDDDGDDDLLGSRLGAYRLVRRVGRGGMGQVYAAVRADGAFAQQVAVKVLRRGLDTDDLLRRFRAERQILAGLQHPHVARLLDGGATDDGRPYLVLEYVEGTPLTDYADARRLTLPDRLRLFLTVCAAVQAAHQALVVHRDLKPSNILVTDDGTVKLLDFGIAKLLDAPEAPLTRSEARLMTPAYASPEQVRGGPITTATDVYALGVVLYELLTGHRPYVLDGASPTEVERRICEQEPPKPSTVVSRGSEPSPAAVAAVRGAAPERLPRLLRGDLDTIVLKALAKEPARRYGSAERLADDLRRHLAGRPVQARPDTLRYRAGRFVRRHRLGVGLGALAALVLLGFTAVTAVQDARIRTQAAAVERERDRAEAVLGFVLDLFSAADPTGRRGTDVTARELLEAGARKVDHELSGQPAVQAAMMDAMGRVYLTLGAYDEAERLGARAHHLRVGAFGPEHTDVAESLHLLGRVAAERSRLDLADSLLSRSLATRRRLLAPGAPVLAQHLLDLAWVRMLRDDPTSADSLGREALALRREAGDPAAVAEALNYLGILHRRRGELDAAARLHEEALALRRRAFGPRHYYVGQSLNNLAIVREEQGRHALAESLLTAALPHYEQALGPDHPDVLNALSNLAKSRYYQGAYAGADSLFRHVLAAYRAQFDHDHRLIALTLNDLGEIQHAWGRLAEAEGYVRESLAMRRRLFGDAHREVAWSLNDLALVRRDRGDLAEAEALLRQALAMQQRLPAPDRERTATLHRLGEVLLARERYADAEPLLREAIALYAAHPHADAALARLTLGECLAALHRYDEAEPLLLNALATLEDRPGPDASRIRAARETLAALRAARR